MTATCGPDQRRDDRPQQRVVGAAEQQRVDRRAGGREDRFAGRIAFAEERRERLGDGRLAVGPVSWPASTSGTSVGVACS